MSKFQKILPLFMLLCILSLSGCGWDTFQFGDTKVKVDPNTGSVQVEDKEGNLSVSATNQLPEGYPEDLFPLPSGVKIVSSLTGEAPNQAVGKTYVVNAESSDSASELIKFYDSRLKDAQNYNKMDMNTSTSMIGSKGGYSFVINVMDNKDNRSITISVTEEKKN